MTLPMSSQNSRKTEEATRAPWRFQPGQSGNPGGRPKGLSVLVRAATGDGEDIVQFYLDVFTGKKRGSGKRSSLSLRMEAAQWLSDRGWGKAEMIVDDKRDKPVLVVYGNGHSDAELPGHPGAD